MKKLYRFFVIIIIIYIPLLNCHKNSWPRTPSSPSGPSLATITDTLYFSAMTTDPEGDNIAYQFDWGTENNSSWSDFLNSGDSITIAHPWNDTGHYNIRVRAMDIKEKISRWSDPHFLDIVISIAPNIPSIFSGPNNGYVNYSYTFSTTTTDPDGDSISYQFDWGDNSSSPWSPYVPSGDSVQMNYSWSLVGTYNIGLKAKDKYGLESGWSPEHLITISNVPNSPPVVPNIPSGPSIGYEDSTYTFSVNTTDPNGDSISYQFDWGDSTYSEWSDFASNGQYIYMNHSYASQRTYSVKVKAKDKNGAESDWSDGHQISIIANNPPNIPSVPSGPPIGHEDSTYTFSATTTDPNGDSIAYQFDWGDGNLSQWSNYVPSSDSVQMHYLWASEDTYNVKVKAKDKFESESGWSPELSVIIKKARLKWKFPLRVDVRSPAIGNDGTIYVNSYGHTLHAVNPNGIEKWTFSTTTLGYSSPVIGNDGTIYVGFHTLYALNPDGTEKWCFSTENTLLSSPAIGSDNTIYVGFSDSNLYAINPDGTKEWTFPTSGYVVSSPAIDKDGIIYVGTKEGNLYAINSDSTEKWVFTMGNRVVSSPVIDSDGTIYISSQDGILYAINPDGTEKWKFSKGFTINSSPAIGNDGTIYIGTWDNNLYAINPDGSQKWAFSTGGDIYSSPAIDDDGTIYVGSSDNKLYAINPNGTEKWAFLTEDHVSSSPAIGNDGTIYVGSTDNKLYAIIGSSGGLANTPWPMFHHDVRHTGRVNTP